MHLEKVGVLAEARQYQLIPHKPLIEVHSNIHGSSKKNKQIKKREEAPCFQLLFDDLLRKEPYRKEHEAFFERFSIPRKYSSSFRFNELRIDGINNVPIVFAPFIDLRGDIKGAQMFYKKPIEEDFSDKPFRGSKMEGTFFTLDNLRDASGGTMIYICSSIQEGIELREKLLVEEDVKIVSVDSPERVLDLKVFLKGRLNNPHIRIIKREGGT